MYPSHTISHGMLANSRPCTHLSGWLLCRWKWKFPLQISELYPCMYSTERKGCQYPTRWLRYFDWATVVSNRTCIIAFAQAWTEVITENVNGSCDFVADVQNMGHIIKWTSLCDLLRKGLSNQLSWSRNWMVQYAGFCCVTKYDYCIYFLMEVICLHLRHCIKTCSFTIEKNVNNSSS